MTAPVSGEASLRLDHHGRGGELFVIFIANLLLSIVTLGVYYFWGKSRVRRYLWSQTSFDGERLEYGGTGLELFVGFLKALLIMFCVMVGMALLELVQPVAGAMAMVALYLLLPVVVGFATFSAQRYKLTRTRLRGVRFGLTGSAWRHGAKVLLHGLLTVVTLGLYYPFMRMKLTGHILQNTRFGSQPFAFDGRGSDLFGRFVVAVLLTVPTLGLVWFWYRAAELRYTMSRLAAGDLAFDVAESDISLAGFFFTNFLIVVLTFGLGMPWVMTRTLQHLGNHLVVRGAMDYDAIRQTERESEAVGEGFAEAFDLGGI